MHCSDNPFLRVINSDFPRMKMALIPNSASRSLTVDSRPGFGGWPSAGDSVTTQSQWLIATQFKSSNLKHRAASATFESPRMHFLQHAARQAFPGKKLHKLDDCYCTSKRSLHLIMGSTHALKRPLWQQQVKCRHLDIKSSTCYDSRTRYSRELRTNLVSIELTL